MVSKVGFEPTPPFGDQNFSLLSTYRHPIIRFFTENEGLIQIKVIITSHDFGLDYTLCASPTYTDHLQVNTRCSENVFTVQDF